MKLLFLVGRNKSGSTLSPVWEFQGIFSSESKAILACKNDPMYFYVRVTLDEELVKHTVEWTNVVYPLRADSE